MQQGRWTSSRSCVGRLGDWLPERGEAAFREGKPSEEKGGKEGITQHGMGEEGNAGDIRGKQSGEIVGIGVKLEPDAKIGDEEGG